MRRMRTKKRISAAIAGLAIALLVAACAPAASPPPPPPGCVGPKSPPDALSVSVLNATNGTRAFFGVGPQLVWNGQLWCLASDWANHLAAIGTLAHRDLQATIRQPEFGFYRTLGENILSGSSTLTGDQMNNAWMNSAEHRGAILNPAFTSMGVAFAFRGNTVYAVNNFGG